MRSVLPLVCPPVQLYVAQLPTVKAWFSTWLQMRCLSAAWDMAVPGSTALRATMRRREVTRGRIMKRLREAWGTTSGLGKLYISRKFATVAELADAPALGAGGATRGGSSPSGRTGRLRRKVVEVGGGSWRLSRFPPPTSTVLHNFPFPHRLDLDHTDARDSCKEDQSRTWRSLNRGHHTAGQREGGRRARDQGLPAARPPAGLPAGQGAGRGGAEEVRRGHPPGNAARAGAGELARRAEAGRTEADRRPAHPQPEMGRRRPRHVRVPRRAEARLEAPAPGRLPAHADGARGYCGPGRRAAQHDA